MSRTIEDAAVKRSRNDTHEQLRDRFQVFVDAYDHVRPLETLLGLTT
ncbi:hypothetical protein ACLBX9_32255 [Methylobacterium sp. A49B]|nr:hypothetical protein [Methylobacterium mesophilicum]